MKSRLFFASALCCALCACAPEAHDARDAAQSANVATEPQAANDAGDKSAAQANPNSAPTASGAESNADASVEATPSDAPPEIPGLKIETLDGKQYDLSTHRGRWVAINFWATWCPPCRKEMPELDAYDAKRDDVELIGLAYEEITSQQMRAFLRKLPVKYPIAIVDTYNPPTDFPTPTGLPMTYLIAPDGRIAKVFTGPIKSADLDNAIAAHASGRKGAMR